MGMGQGSDSSGETVGGELSPMDEERANEARITELARQLTRQSSRHQDAQGLSRPGTRQSGANGGGDVNSDSGDFLIEKGTGLLGLRLGTYRSMGLGVIPVFSRRWGMRLMRALGRSGSS
jgi:hypothetical protein